MRAKRANVRMTATVPADFEAAARRLGYSSEELLWRLAEDVCARPPEVIIVVDALEPPAPERASYSFSRS